MGKKPWSIGYVEYKWNYIVSSLKNKDIIDAFKLKMLPKNFGLGLDERSVEYGWVFSNLGDRKQTILDAGSVFNYSEIIDLDFLKNKQLTIFTFYPEDINFNKKCISYVYGDLRDMMFRDNYFEEIVCQSTIEHVDMDNSMYGYTIKNSGNGNIKSYEYLKVITELCRILSKGGTLLLTFPFGKFENHGFFQQFDSEMIQKIKDYLEDIGTPEVNFIKYSKEGWNFAEESECVNLLSYNPHTNTGKGDDGAAHSRSVCCIKFKKNGKN